MSASWQPLALCDGGQPTKAARAEPEARRSQPALKWGATSRLNAPPLNERSTTSPEFVYAYDRYVAPRRERRVRVSASVALRPSRHATPSHGFSDDESHLNTSRTSSRGSAAGSEASVKNYSLPPYEAIFDIAVDADNDDDMVHERSAFTGTGVPAPGPYSIFEPAAAPKFRQPPAAAVVEEPVKKTSQGTQTEPTTSIDAPGIAETPTPPTPPLRRQGAYYKKQREDVAEIPAPSSVSDLSSLVLTHGVASPDAANAFKAAVAQRARRHPIGPQGPAPALPTPSADSPHPPSSIVHRRTALPARAPEKKGVLLPVNRPPPQRSSRDARELPPSVSDPQHSSGESINLSAGMRLSDCAVDAVLGPRHGPRESRPKPTKPQRPRTPRAPEPVLPPLTTARPLKSVQKVKRRSSFSLSSVIRSHFARTPKRRRATHPASREPASPLDLRPLEVHTRPSSPRRSHTPRRRPRTPHRTRRVSTPATPLVTFFEPTSPTDSSLPGEVERPAAARRSTLPSSRAEARIREPSAKARRASHPGVAFATPEPPANLPNWRRPRHQL